MKNIKNSNENKHFENVMIGSGLQEMVTRYGSAGAEFLKGLRGIDYETGIKFDRSLLDVSNYKINPDYVERNIKQQAGFSAEIAAVSKKNAEAIINKTGVVTARSEDIAEYGKNHNAVDLVERASDGTVVTSQMKFVSNYENLLDKIAKGEGGGKNDLSRYLEVDHLDLPTEQVEKAKEYCEQQIEKLEEQIAKLEQAPNKAELVDKYRKQCENFKKIKEKIRDSEITTNEAIKYRMDPTWETIKDIASISHRAGIQGAKVGAAIGGSISLITNIIAVRAGNKEFGDAIFDTTKDTLKAAGVGYGTAFVGAAIKGTLQQSSSSVLRAVSKTGLPAMVVSTCLATGGIIKKYALGEIDETLLLREMGAVANNTLASAAFSAIGQIAIPIPVLGGLIGGMIGYTLTNTFYQNFLLSLDEVDISEQRYQFLAMRCEAAKQASQQYQNYLMEVFNQKIYQLDNETSRLFKALQDPTISADSFCLCINQFAEFLGKDLAIKNMEELDDMMSSEQKFEI